MLVSALSVLHLNNRLNNRSIPAAETQEREDFSFLRGTHISPLLLELSRLNSIVDI